MKLSKQQYLDSLKQARIADQPVEGDDAAPVAVTPPPEAEHAAPVARAHTPAESASEAAPVAVAEADPVDTAIGELIPGYSALADDKKKSIREKWEAAARVDSLAQEKAKVEHDLRTTQNRVGPQERQLHQLQQELARATDEAAKLRGTQSATANTQLRQKIDAIRDQFPDDAALFDGTLAEAQDARKYAAGIEEKLKKLENQLFMQTQLQELSRMHPDFEKKRAALFKDETTGALFVRRTVETPEARELEVWANALDPYERNMIWPLFKSNRAQDAGYILNRFEQDRALAHQYNEGQNGHVEPQAVTASPARAAPVADPDPSRRTTAPSLKTAGQPQSEQKTKYLASIELARKQGLLPPIRKHA